MIKRILLFTAVLCFFAGTVFAQNQLDINKAVTRVNNEGIIFPEPEFSFTFYDEFFEYNYIPFDTTGLIGALTYDFSNLGWIVTDSVGATTVVMFDTTGGVVRFTNNAGDNAGRNMQWNCEPFFLGHDEEIIFEAKVKMTDATQSDLLIGLFITNDNLLIDGTDGIGFYKVDAIDSLWAISLESSVGDTVKMDYKVVVGQWMTLRMVVRDSSTVRFTVDGSYGMNFSDPDTTAAGAIYSTAFPLDEALTPSVQFINGVGVSKEIEIDYIYVRQRRK